jgi:hypothetical protein
VMTREESSDSLKRSWASFAASLLLGGLPFSLVLLRLGIDIESPQLLRYSLFATPYMVLLVSVILLMSKSRRAWVSAMGLSIVSWVPLEACVYVISSWGLRGWKVFAPSNLTLLLLMLLIWAFVTGAVSALIALALKAFRRPNLNGAD